MTEDDLLFDLGDEVAVVTVSGNDRNTGIAQAAWKLWTELTGRPKGPAPRPFLKMYREYLDLGYSAQHMEDIVRGAARVDPHKRDAADTRRLLNALDKESCERAALALLRRGAPVKPWPKDTGRLQDRCQIEDVAELCGYKVDEVFPESGPSLWTQDEFDGAGTLMGMLDRNELTTATDNVKAHLGLDVVTPEEVIRFKSLWSSTSVKSRKRAGRDTYQAGESESTHLQDVDLSNDPDARGLLLDGCPTALVSNFHAEMPPLYWMRVEDMASKGKTVEEAYDSLRDEMGIDARDREVPSW